MCYAASRVTESKRDVIVCRCPLNRVYAYTGVAPKRLHGYCCRIFSSLRGRCGVSPYTFESFYDPKGPS